MRGRMTVRVADDRIFRPLRGLGINAPRGPPAEAGGYRLAARYAAAVHGWTPIFGELY